MNIMLGDLSEALKQGGLKIQWEKCTSARTPNSPAALFAVNGIVIPESCENFIQLGCKLPFDHEYGPSVSQRIQKAWSQFFRLRSILLNRRSPLNQRLHFWRQSVTSVLLYSCEVWTLRKSDEDLPNHLENQMFRKIAMLPRSPTENVWDYKIRTAGRLKEWRERNNLHSFVKLARIRKWTWAGHVARFSCDRLLGKVLADRGCLYRLAMSAIRWMRMEGYGTYGLSRRGKHRRWEDQIETFVKRTQNGEAWVDFARRVSADTWNQMAECFASERVGWGRF